ncbi:MAG: hypothetical protein IH787_03945 [Nitrospirae bacterium]|nr:hypothetical protein [Nitrospirota bacterium]
MQTNSIVIVTLLALAATAPTAFCADRDIPRTANGKPDFTGRYDISSLTPFQRPEELGERLFLTQDEANAMASKAAKSRATQAQQDLVGQAEFANGEYKLVIRRALSTGDEEDLVIPSGQFFPIAFSAVEGRSEEASDSGAISSWQLLFLDEPTAAASYIWVPIAIALTAGLEWLVVRRVRRSTSA